MLSRTLLGSQAPQISGKQTAGVIAPNPSPPCPSLEDHRALFVLLMCTNYTILMYRSISIVDNDVFKLRRHDAKITRLLTTEDSRYPVLLPFQPIPTPPPTP